MNSGHSRLNEEVYYLTSTPCFASVDKIYMNNHSPKELGSLSDTDALGLRHHMLRGIDKVLKVTCHSFDYMC